ncbi:hypothetical protein EC988_007920, partial [Linderina pennispora]
MTTCNIPAEVSRTLPAPTAGKPAATGAKRKLASSIPSAASKFSPPKKARSSSNTVCTGAKRSHSDSAATVPPAKNAGSSAGIASDEQTIWWDNKYEELAEADYWVKERLIRDADAVFDIVEPRITTTCRLASLVSAQVALELEHRLNTVDNS